MLILIDPRGLEGLDSPSQAMTQAIARGDIRAVTDLARIFGYTAAQTAAVTLLASQAYSTDLGLQAAERQYATRRFIAGCDQLPIGSNAYCNCLVLLSEQVGRLETPTTSRAFIMPSDPAYSLFNILLAQAGFGTEKGSILLGIVAKYKLHCEWCLLPWTWW